LTSELPSQAELALEQVLELVLGLEQEPGLVLVQEPEQVLVSGRHSLPSSTRLPT